MYLFQRCAVCGRLILVGARRAGNCCFCSKGCQDLASHPGFCARCLRATLDESAGALSRNLVGTAFFGSWNRCPACGSVEALKVMMAILPIYPIARYRLIRFSRGTGDALVLSRRIPGRALTGQILATLGWMALIAVGAWAAFIAWLVTSHR